MYYTITTITTVGYGDITGTNSIERSISAFLEVFGVCFFAVVSGKILNIIGNFETRD
jgi:voltage-gated potassium channel